MTSYYTTSEPMEGYFQGRVPFVFDAISRFNISKMGSIEPITTKIEKYCDYCSIPLIGKNTLDYNISELKIGKLLKGSTSGTTGQPTKVYHSIPTKIKINEGSKIPFIPKELLDEMKNKRGTFLRYEHKFDTFADTRDAIFKSIYPDSFFSRLADKESAMAAAKEGDVLVFYDYPSAVYRFLYFIKSAIDEGELNKNKIKKSSAFIELCGEPIEKGDLKRISNLADELFGTTPLFTLTYGMEDVGLIGTVKLKENFDDFKYELTPNVFAEIINSDGLPLGEGKKGEIVITSPGTYSPNAVRYKTGDMGILFLNPIPSLKLFGRKEELGYVYVCGEKFSLPMLAKSLRRAFDLPSQIECKRVVNENTGVVELNFGVYIPKSSDAVKGTIKTHIMDFITNTTDLLPELGNKLALINVDFKEDQFMEKEWRKL